jgi:hypothetical protein
MHAQVQENPHSAIITELGISMLSIHLLALFSFDLYTHNNNSTLQSAALKMKEEK